MICACAISPRRSQWATAISHQLRVLRAAKLVKFRRDGKEVWYSLDDEHVVDLMRQSLEHISHTQLAKLSIKGVAG